MRRRRHHDPSGFRHLPVVDEETNLIGLLALSGVPTANRPQMLTRTRRHRAQETYILLAGVAVYTVLIVTVVSLAL